MTKHTTIELIWYLIWLKAWARVEITSNSTISIVFFIEIKFDLFSIEFTARDRFQFRTKLMQGAKQIVIVNALDMDVNIAVFAAVVSIRNLWRVS